MQKGSSSEETLKGRIHGESLERAGRASPRSVLEPGLAALSLSLSLSLALLVVFWALLEFDSGLQKYFKKLRD